MKPKQHEIERLTAINAELLEATLLLQEKYETDYLEATEHYRKSKCPMATKILDERVSILGRAMNDLTTLYKAAIANDTGGIEMDSYRCPECGTGINLLSRSTQAQFDELTAINAELLEACVLAEDNIGDLQILRPIRAAIANAQPQSPNANGDQEQ